MAPATSVGGTHDTEGRADTNLTVCPSVRLSVTHPHTEQQQQLAEVLIKEERRYLPPEVINR